MTAQEKETARQKAASGGAEIVNCRVAAIERAGGTFAKIARELCGIAFSDVADYVTVAEGGEVQAIPTDKIPKRKRKAIKKIREKRRILNAAGKDDDVILDQTTEYELYDKLDALKYLCRLRGDEVQKVQHDGQLTVKVVNFADGNNDPS